MSLCDVIYHACMALPDDTFDLALHSMPLLCQHFSMLGNESSSVLFSLMGKSDAPALLKECRVFVECILAVVAVLKAKVEPFAKELIHRAIALAHSVMP